MNPLTTGHCPSQDDWRLFLLGRVEPTRIEALEAHLVDCSVCLRQVATLEADDESLRALQARLAATPNPASVAGLIRRVQQLYNAGAENGLPATLPYRMDPSLESDLPRVAGYDVRRKLGEGGMSIVYLAWQHSLPRFVALKMIREGSLATAAETARIFAEAELVARLRHPNIVQIHEIGEHEGRPFLALEYVPNGSLAERSAGKPHDPLAAATLVETLARAIQHAHENHIIHRDLKPANVLLLLDKETRRQGDKETGRDEVSLSPCLPVSLSDCVPKLTDFGLAKKLDEPGLTASGAIVGTPSYMAPEQAMARKDIGAAVDVYALGAILYELLTGRPPFIAATTYETVRQVINEEPVPPRRMQPLVPGNLETICLKCLRKEPDKRYRSAATLADDLCRFMNHEPIHARPTPRWERAWMWSGRHPARAALAAVSAAVILAVVVAGIVWQHRDSHQISSLRAAMVEKLQSGRGDMDSRNYSAAQTKFEDVGDQLAKEPALADLIDPTQFLIEQARRATEQEHRDQQAAAARQAAQQLASNFRKERDQSLFAALQSLWIAIDGRPAAIAGAQAALQQVETLPNALNEDERNEIAAGKYMLLLTLVGLVDNADEGLALLNRAAAIRQTGRAWHERRANLLQQKGDAAGQRQARETMKGTPPADAIDHFLLGQPLLARQQFTQAMDHFREALRDRRLDPFWPEFALAICFFQQKQPEQAVEHLSACAALQPDFAWTYIQRGLVRGALAAQGVPDSRPFDEWRRQQFQLAEDDFRRADALPLAKEERYVLANNRAVTFIKGREPKRAVAELERAIAQQPDAYIAYANLAEAYLRLGQLEAALAQLDAAIKRKPDLASLWQKRGDMRGRLACRNEFVVRFVAPLPNAARPAAQRTAALADYTEALQLLVDGKAFPLELAMVHVARGQLSAQMKRFPDAAHDFLTAQTLAPTLEEAHLGLGGVFLERKEYAKATQAFGAYLRHGGRPNANVYEAMSIARAGAREYSAALADIDSAIHLDPSSSQLHARRGWLRVLSGEPHLAYGDFKNALELDAAHADALAGRGYVLAQLGRYREAAADGDAILTSHASPDRELRYKLVGLYAQAARAAAQTNEPGGPAWRVVADYEDRALALLQLVIEQWPAEERPTFWRTAAADDALKGLRARPAYQELARRYGRAPLQAGLGP
jgi:serine/threonine protein kinase/tetratricopeptide (TPR) repeat protein